MLEYKYKHMEELLKWFSPERFKDYEGSYARYDFLYLCSNEGFAAYQLLKPVKVLGFSRFKRDLNSICRRNHTVRVTKNHQPVGRFYTVKK